MRLEYLISRDVIGDDFFVFDICFFISILMVLLIFLFLPGILIVFVIFIGMAGGIIDIFLSDRVVSFHTTNMISRDGICRICRDYFFSDRRDRWDDTILDI